MTLNARIKQQHSGNRFKASLEIVRDNCAQIPGSSLINDFSAPLNIVQNDCRLNQPPVANGAVLTDSYYYYYY